MAFLAIYLAAAGYAFYALIDLPAVNNIPHHQRVQKRGEPRPSGVASEEDRRCKEDEQIAACDAQKAREIEMVAKRRQAT